MRRLLGIAIALLPALASAQLVESIEVRITNIDVVVTDRTGRPVTGLGRSDFELFENGRAQAITNFFAVDRGLAAAAAAGEAVRSPDAVAAARSESRRRRIVFFIDNDSLEPAQRNRFIATLEKEIAHLVQPGDEATLIVWNHRAVSVQPFTSDVAALQGALREQTKRAGNSGLLAGKSMMQMRVRSLYEAARSNPLFAPRFYQESQDMVSAWAEEVYATQKRIVNGLSATIGRMAGVEGKKVVVFATGGLPERAGVEMYQWVESLFRIILPAIPARARIDGATRSITPDLERLAKKANTDGVTMYMIDASGSIRTSMTAEQFEVPDSIVEFLERSNTAGSLQMIASLTGGIALTNTDNFKVAMDTIARDLDSYYSLGYRSEGEDPRNRKVVVKVKRPDLIVRSRRSWAPKPAAEQIEDRLIANIFHSGIDSDFGVDVALRGEPQARERGLYNLPLRVTIPSTLTLLPDGGDVAGGFAIWLVVGGPRGDLSKVSHTEHSVRVPAAEEASLRSTPVIYDVDLLVREGEQTLSIGVVDRVSNQVGFARKKVVARQGSWRHE